MTGSDKYLAASITIALRVGPGKLSCVISVVMMSERSWYRWLLLKIAYHVSCSLNFDHESNCIGRYWHLSGCVSVFITFIVNRIFRCIPRKHTVLARTHASHSSSDPAPLPHQYLLVIRAIVVLNIKCLALRQHQKESVQMQMVMIPPWTFLTNSNVVDIDQIVTTSILSHTSWTHSQGNLFLLLTDIRLTPQDNTHLGPGGLKGIFYGPYLTTAVTRHVLSANAQLYPFLCLCTASSNPYSLLCMIYTFVHLYTFVPRFVPPDVHTPKYTLILHNYSTTSRIPKIDTEFGSYERK